jgi:hypothetical protein
MADEGTKATVTTTNEGLAHYTIISSPSSYYSSDVPWTMVIEHETLAAATTFVDWINRLPIPVSSVVMCVMIGLVKKGRTSGFGLDEVIACGDELYREYYLDRPNKRTQDMRVLEKLVKLELGHWKHVPIGESQPFVIPHAVGSVRFLYVYATD